MTTRSHAFRPARERDGVKPPAGNWRQERSTRSVPDAVSETRPERRQRHKAEGAAAMAEHLARTHDIDERTRQLRAMRLARDEQEAMHNPTPDAAPKLRTKKAHRRPFVQSVSR